MGGERINPVQALLSQAIALADPDLLRPKIDYEELAKAAIKAVREEEKRMRSNPKVLLTQDKANKIYGQNVIRSLFKRGLIEPYKFDFRDTVDEEGNLIKKTKGVIYYRVSDIESAIEEGNVLKGTRRGTI